MRLDITPLGASGRSVATVARDVVGYLEGGRDDPGVALLAGDDSDNGGGVPAYYGDSAEGPGRWIGAGAAYHGLDGTVQRDALARLLEGRHPHTGARLLTARGSSQRRHLAVGQAQRFDALGAPLYTVSDTAALLGLTKTEVATMIAATDSEVDDDRGLMRTVTVDGDVYIPDSEIGRHLELAAHPATAADVLASGDPDDLLSVAQAARLLGVSARYVRRLCARCEPDAAAGVEGDGSGGARLAATKAGPRGSWLIRRADLAAFAECRRPPVARVGYDITLTTEKSFAVAMMLAEPATARRFVDALDVANSVAIAYLDRHAAVARRGGQVVASEGLVGASYLHATSRALDPHPHRHNVIANAVVDDHGAVRALDARALYGPSASAEALATAAARWELRNLGIGWWRRDDGIWEIAGVDERTIAEFSSRHREIREITEALEAQLGRSITAAEDQRVWADTRDDKRAVDPIWLRQAWRDRADRVGFDVTACFDRADRAIAYDTLPPDLAERLFADLVAPDHGVCASVDRFDRGDVIGAIADWSVLDLNGRHRKVLLPSPQIETLTDRFLACEHVIALAPELGRGTIRRGDGRVVDDGQLQRCFSTTEILQTQHRLLTAWHQGCNIGRGIVAEETIDTVLGDHHQLSAEQHALVRAWCRSGDLAQGAIGRAGTARRLRCAPPPTCGATPVTGWSARR